MLREIRIQNLGVIDDAVLELSAGLNVVTGETGAGKTMVVSGLGLLLGARADAGLVRTGARSAVVEGMVDVDETHPAAVRAAEAGGDVQDGLILARTVSAEGRSKAHVGGRTAPVSVLGELGEHARRRARPVRPVAAAPARAAPGGARPVRRGRGRDGARPTTPAATTSSTGGRRGHPAARAGPRPGP